MSEKYQPATPTRYCELCNTALIDIEYCNSSLTTDGVVCLDGCKPNDREITATSQEMIEQVWKPIGTAPKDSDTPIRVAIMDEGEEPQEYYAIYQKWGCTGTCTPAGVKEHTPHFHDGWIITDYWGEELHPKESFTVIYPNYWRSVVRYAPSSNATTPRTQEAVTND